MKTIEEMAREAGSDANELSGDAIGRFAALVRAEALEDGAIAIERLRDDHCKGTGGECDDEGCDFVAAWDDAAAAIRALAKEPKGCRR